MDIASGRDNWRQDRESESEGGKEGERDREVDDRGSGLSRPRRGSPARTVAAAQTHKVRTHRQRTLASSSSVCAPQRKAACGLVVYWTLLADVQLTRDLSVVVHT